MVVCLIMTAIGFISGSVMYSFIILKTFREIDLRLKSSDGNPGAANAIALAGAPIGLSCMALDILKAFLPVYISVALLNVAGYRLIPVMAAPVLGHAFSPFLRFKGGKAVAVSYGSLLGIAGISKAAFVLAFVMIILRFVVRVNPDSLKVIASFVIASLALLAAEPLLNVKISACVISFIVCYKHLTNPNKGNFSVAVGRFALCREDKGFKLIKAT